MAPKVLSCMALLLLAVGIEDSENSGLNNSIQFNCLDLDHLAGTKVFNITDNIQCYLIINDSLGTLRAKVKYVKISVFYNESNNEDFQTNCEQIDNFSNTHRLNFTMATTTTSPTCPTCPNCSVIVPSQSSQSCMTQPTPTTTIACKLDTPVQTNNATTSVTPTLSHSQPQHSVLVESPTSLSVTSTSSLEATERGVCTNSLAILGALLGISIVLLAVVTAGWVCTCVIMKKKQSPAENRKTVFFYENDKDDSNAERILQNPIYDSTTNTHMLTSSTAESAEEDNQPTSTSMYDTIQPLSQAAGTVEGHIYDVLNRSQATGTNTTEICTRDEKRPPDNESYSQLQKFS